MPKKKITINDIAKEAGVSRALVSFILSNEAKGEKIYRVSDGTTRKVLDIIRKYDYHPSDSARRLRSGESGIIGVILSDISNYFYAEISKHIVEWSYESEYTVIFCSTDEDLTKLKHTYKFLCNKGVDGMIIVPPDGSEELIKQYAKDTPIILLDREIPGSGISCVILDNEKASYELVQNVAKEGYRHIEFISYKTNLSNIKAREKGYVESMADLGLAENIRIHTPEYGNYEQTEAIMLDAAKRNVDALVFSTHKMMLIGRKAIVNNRSKIKKDFSFSCFNNSETFDIYEKNMIFVQQPIDQFGKRSVELLESIIGRKSEGERILLQPEVVTVHDKKF